MKILIIRTFPDKLNLDSYNVQEVGLAKALVKKGHICDVVLYNGKEKDYIQSYSFICEDKEYEFKIYWLSGFGILKNGFMPSVKRIIPKYDVIQVHEYEQVLSWELYTRQKKPTVIYHGPYYDRFAKGYNLKCKVFDKVFLPLREYENVVTISKSILAADFLKTKGFKNVTTVGVGINIENFGNNNLILNNRQFIQNNKKILYIGKLEERRNLFFMVDVFRKIQKKIPQIQFVIIGNGEREYKRKFLESIKDEINQEKIIYHERASQSELVKYYIESAFFMLASQYEIFGMVLLEAMYFGVPVISSINGGSSTIIKHGLNGFIMETFDAQQWANCMVWAMENDEFLEIIKKNAKKTVEENYTWDELATRFLSLYEKAIEQK